jgi:hypothetical protein
MKSMQSFIRYCLTRSALGNPPDDLPTFSNAASDPSRSTSVNAAVARSFPSSFALMRSRKALTNSTAPPTVCFATSPAPDFTNSSKAILAIAPAAIVAGSIINFHNNPIPICTTNSRITHSSLEFLGKDENSSMDKK